MPDGQWNDEILTARIAQGDANALESLYDRHAPLVLGLALRIIGDRTLAEEVLQETFWQVWQRAATYQPAHGSISMWLFRITRRLAIDTSRQRSGQPQASPR